MTEQTDDEQREKILDQVVVLRASSPEEAVWGPPSPSDIRITNFILKREAAMLRIAEAARPLQNCINDIYNPPNVSPASEFMKHLCNLAVVLRDEEARVWPKQRE